MIFHSHSIELCELAKAPTKIVCNQVVPFLRFKDTATLYPPRRSEDLQKRTHLLCRQSARFQKLSIMLASVYRFSYRSPKLRLDLQSQKTISLLITITISLNIQIDKFVHRSDLGTTILASFPSKRLNYTAIIIFLQKLSTLTIAKFTISTRTDTTLQTSVKELRAITMCGAFTLDCGYDNSTIILIVYVYCPNERCLGKLCLHKKTFQSLGRSDFQCPQCASVCQVRNIPFEHQSNSFFLSFGQGVYIFEENPKSIQHVNGDVYCPGKFCSKR